jgi:hypothetical protein
VAEYSRMLILLLLYVITCYFCMLLHFIITCYCWYWYCWRRKLTNSITNEIFSPVVKKLKKFYARWGDSCRNCNDNLPLCFNNWPVYQDGWWFSADIVYNLFPQTIVSPVVKELETFTHWEATDSQFDGVTFRMHNTVLAIHETDEFDCE